MPIKRYIGLGKETTFGTAAATPKYVMDPESAEIDPSGDSVNIYEGASGFDNLATPGRYDSGGSFSVPVNSDTIGQLLYYTLGAGGYTKTGTGSITHTFKPSGAALMDSFTAFVGKDLFEHQFTGCSVSGLTLELADGIMTASVDLIGGKDANVSIGSGKTLYTSGNVYAAHDVNFTIAGTSGSARIESFTLRIETGAENGFGIGSRYPVRSYRGSMNVECDVTLGFYDLAELQRFWGGSSGPTNTLTFFAATIDVGTELDISLPRCFYSSLSQPLGGRGRITQSGTIKAIMDSAGTGPVEATLINSVTDYSV